MRKSFSRRGERLPPEDAAPADEPPFTIYSVPTVDTLDDVPYQPSLSRTSPGANTSVNDYSTPTRNSQQQVSGTPMSRSSGQSRPSESPIRSARKVMQSTPARNSPRPPRPTRSVISKRQKKKPRDFQFEEDTMKVTARTIDLATRTAFEPIRPVSIEEWQSIADHAGEVRQTNMRKKMSPSLQHLELLHKMQATTSIRQLAFSPSCGLESDIFVPWDEDLADATTMGRRRRRGKTKRDGRYHSIDPLKSVTAALPSHPPTLSIQRYRLPMRSDVGFPNASEEEIIHKQQEIQRETEWEEASPRLVVLVTSDDIGSAITGDPSPAIFLQHDEFNGGGLEGMPLAGKELMMAKERNLRLSRRASDEWSERFPKWKPNLTSMLAPPLDATYSSTVDWRPRPFYDQPPGIVHCLACPLNVRFDIGNIEPMVGSLALYTLPTDPGRNGAYGKMSEEFYFPVGMWKGHVQLEAARTVKGAIDAEMIEAWYGRKHKALFSYDPLAVPWGRASLHLVLQVFKVPHANPVEPYLASKRKKRQQETKLDDLPGSTQKTKGIGRRLKGTIGKMKQSGDGSSEDADALTTKARSGSTFKAIGTQFLSPLCFGVVPLFPRKVAEAMDENVEEGIRSLDDINLSWPNGETEEMQLYAVPSSAMSQNEFLKCVSQVAADEANANLQARRSGASQMDADDARNSSCDLSHITESDTDGQEIISTASSGSLPPAGSKNSITASKGDSSIPSKRSIFRRSSKKAASGNRKVDSGGLDKIAGAAVLFTSTIGSDFTQSMLNTPRELLDTQTERGIHSLPRLLVDVSGDCAIMMNPSAAQVSTIVPAQGYEAGRKRSDLVRLPLASNPSGYADASEVRELMYLPPRPEKQYDVDAPGSFRTCLNLLYMYPHLLKRVQETDEKEEPSTQGRGRQTRKDSSSYSVRIQLVRNSVHVDPATGHMESSQETLESFHNPAPWAGPQMLQAIYTKMNVGSKHQPHDIAHGGIPLRDEIKMRLPMVLDGSYFLQFTLFSVKFSEGVGVVGTDVALQDAGLSVDALAETTIPLSSSSNREPKSGLRVTTVIPNGCHRIRLGAFQLQLETRLVSSIHVCDPTVATVLRDFPYARDRHDIAENAELKELALLPSRSIVGKSPSADPIVDIRVPIHDMFAAASENSLFGQFPVLVYMHLCNLVNHATGPLKLSGLISLYGTDVEQEDSASDEVDVKFAMDNVTSLLEIFRKVKAKLLTQLGSRRSRRRVDVFVKNFIDSFDETALLREKPVDADADGISAEKSGSSLSEQTPQKNQVTEVDDDNSDDEDHGDGSVVRLKRKDYTHSKSLATFNKSGAPFSRVAYGASKTDRMRVEAELFHASNNFTHLFDDDETVATALQHRTGGGKVEDSGTNGEMSPRRLGALDDTSSHTGSEDSFVVRSPGKSTQDTPQAGRGIAESGFVKRVRTAAQVMIAPCMAPSMSTVLAAGTSNSPPSSNAVQHMRDLRSAVGSTLSATILDKTNAFDGQNKEAELVYVYPGSDVDEEVTLSKVENGTNESLLRCDHNVRAISFTIAGPGKSRESENRAQRFVYEVVMVLWLRSWQEQIGKLEHDSPSSSKYAAFHAPTNTMGVSGSEPFFSFHSQIDFLLPLCLKSFLLRCTAVVCETSPADRIGLDRTHMQVLVPFVEMLSHCLIGEALMGPNDGGESDAALLQAFSTAELVLDFLVGLASALHPQHMAVLLSKHFHILRECETSHGRLAKKSSAHFMWNEHALRRVRCSRQLRLRSIERLACMPNFVALNYPLKYNEGVTRAKRRTTSWAAQNIESGAVGDDPAIMCPYPDGRDRLPQSGWLASLLAGEALLISSLSCEAVVAEAIAHVETSHPDSTGSPPKAKSSPSSFPRPGVYLKRDDLLVFQSTAIHAITCVYELLLRRHAMDARFQSDQARGRIAALFTPTILDKSLASTRWLARMEATHKVRSTWLLSFIYILQESPEGLLRACMHSYCSEPEFKVHKFIRLLRLSSATFQSFIEPSQHSSSASVLSEGLAPWLLQESFNTICAAANMLVDECTISISAFPREEKKMTQGILDLLLHVLTAPQSSVTYLRTVGGALQTLNKLGVGNFLEVSGGTIQHWVRVMLALMNSVSLSVRSIAVDFIISLLGATFNLKGNIDEIAIIFATIMPEVVAREIALYSVNGLIKTIEDVECAVWPLRRSLADVEEANPLDDDRVDPQLSPLLSTFCRACQAIIDGVLIELRLNDIGLTIVGSKVQLQPRDAYIFDADEESLYEAASFFVPETAPLQRLRWLFSLVRLHESKGQWVEAAETLIQCARTVSDAIPYVKSVWRPSRFLLWYDSRRSLWLSMVGKENGHPDRGHEQVMQFADGFLESYTLLEDAPSRSTGLKLQQPSVEGMCKILTKVTQQAVSNYLKEDGMEELASSRLEALLQVVMHAIEEHNIVGPTQGHKPASRRRMAEEVAALRRVSASLNANLTKISESIIIEAKEESFAKTVGQLVTLSPNKMPISPRNEFRRQYYVRVLLSGKKPHRFKESTTIPTFLEWNNPCICRVPRTVVESVVASGARDPKMMEERICGEFGNALRDGLVKGPEATSLMFRIGGNADDSVNVGDTSTTFLDVSMVHMDLRAANGNGRDIGSPSRQSRYFFYRKSSSSCEPPPTSPAPGREMPELVPDLASNLVELTVAHSFPCALSRQRTLLTSEFLANTRNEM